MSEGFLRVGIVGCGNIARIHAEALSAIEGAALVACCDSDPARARSLAADFGAEIAAETLCDLFERGQLDAVLICTPHPAHEAVVVAAAEAGVNVLCEKPIAVRLEEADRMIAATDAAGVAFGVIFQRRFWPAAQRMRKAIDDGLLGKLTFGAAYNHLWRPESYFRADAWRGKWETEGGGVMMNQAVHTVDLLQWFMGPAAEVYGRIATLRHGAYIDVEDTVAATVVFESGALGSIEALTTIEPDFGFRVAIHGDNGATASVHELPEGTQGVNDLWTFEPGVGERAAWEAAELGHPGFPSFHHLQIAEFLDAIRVGRQPAVTGRDARNSLAIILGIYESSQTGKPVLIDR
jgi:UDP-N-acetyl-2-amino-2-deoxyglucuronate dehydrogenase